jgi:hypothetical protein
MHKNSLTISVICDSLISSKPVSKNWCHPVWETMIYSHKKMSEMLCKKYLSGSKKKIEENV